MSALTRFNFSYLCLNGTNSTKSTSEQVSTLGVNPTTAAEVEQSALAREHAVFRAPGPGPLTAFSGRTIRNTHWRWLLVSVSMARSNSRDQSGTSLWHLVRKQWEKDCETVLTVWTNRRNNTSDHWLEQHCTSARTDQKRNTLQEPRWTVRKNPRCASRSPRDRDTCLIEAGVNGAL